MKYVLVTCALIFPTLVSAKSLEGVVRGAGSHLDYHVVLKEKDDKTTHALCKGQITDSINRYHRLTAKVEVEEAITKEGCFNPTSFSLVKAPSGNEPVIGSLKKADSGYSISSKGVTYGLEDIPKGLMALENKEVVVDLAPSLSKDGKAKKLYNVTYFAPAP